MATQHCAFVYRPEEGHVLVNAHPDYNNSHAIAGTMNEPLKNEPANMRMVNSYAKFLTDDDPQLVALQLQQPPGAAAAWRAHIKPPVCSTADAKRAAALGFSEKMVLCGQRAAEPKTILWVDFEWSVV